MEHVSITVNASQLTSRYERVAFVAGFGQGVNVVASGGIDGFFANVEAESWHASGAYLKGFVAGRDWAKEQAEAPGA
jgi:hypothetical protein